MLWRLQYLLPFVAFLIAVLARPALASPQVIDELFKAAVENTAALKQMQLNVQIAQQQKSMAIAQVLPQVALESTNVWRDQAPVGAFGEAYQHTALASLNQPIFRGGSAYYQLKIAQNLPKVAELEKEQ